jgi:hypothetical protein
VVNLGVVGLWVCCWVSELGYPSSGASRGSSGKGFLTLTVYAASEGPRLDLVGHQRLSRVAVVVSDPPQSRKSPVSCQRQLITVREVAQNRFQLRGKGFLGVWGPPWPGGFLLRKIVRTTWRGR